MVLAIAARWQTLGNPVVGYDEQFYLLVGDRMWHGALPYVDIFDRKPIGLFLIYAGARALGGDGFLQYQLVALGFVVATAYLIYRAADKISTPYAAFVAAALYIFWLNFMEGEGGQAELLINLPMLAAALLVWQAVEARERIVARGVAAMLLVGVALQIKYTVVFEGIFLGCVLLWVQYLAHRRLSEVIIPALLWIGCALLPTALVMLVYWQLGALQPFIFANFFSQFGRPSSQFSAQFLGLAIICGIMLPLAVLVARGWRVAPSQSRFLYAWLGAAVLGVIAFGSFLSPHYAQTLVAPFTILSALTIGRTKRTHVLGSLFALVFFLVGQIVLDIVYTGKGGRAETRAIAQAAQPVHGCLYVYDGYPALYMLTHSCLPTRWAFPGQLNTHSEDSAKALGVDPLVEEQRILATRPEVIVDFSPEYSLGNKRTHGLLQRTLAQSYRLTHRFRTGNGEYRLVYRRVDAAL